MIAQGMRTPGEAKTNSRDFREDNDRPAGVIDVERKRLVSLEARAAMAGFELRECVSREDGAIFYTVTRCSFSRDFGSLEAVSDWIDRVTGSHATHDPGRRERARRQAIDAANRRLDQIDEAADYLRGPGGHR